MYLIFFKRSLLMRIVKFLEICINMDLKKYMTIL